MWYTRSLFISAVILFVLPFLGIPQLWKDIITIAIGILIAVFMVRMRQAEKHDTGTFKEIVHHDN